MQAVESLRIWTLIGSVYLKYIKLRWKNTEELCFMALKNDAKYEEKLSLGFKNYIRNLVNFTQPLISPKISMCYFCPKYTRFQLKKCRLFIFHDTEVVQNLNKFWPCGFKNGIIIWMNFHQSTQNLKNCTMMGPFCKKHLMFQVKKFQRNYVSWH